ncbi:polysaccharide deacetylase family protein [Proteinivorax hydrogeniformans]|uniref:Polysaccharide deacetylase family protein n=1 Tax=Proteinivorax hydrogeniformans TaxID=1826727 RepID=A0AAU8HTQ5_9FIRM
MKKFFALFIVLILVLATLGCTDNSQVVSDDKEGDKVTDKKPEDDNDKPDKTDDTKPKIDFDEVQPNEAGEIMVLMYHSIAPEEDTWVRTPDNFRKDLEKLYKNGYRLVSMRDVIKGNIDIEAGKSPVVLTFDDGTQGHFNYIEKDGDLVIDPDSAVGILLEMNEKYPDFGTAATFYINSNPFRQPEYAERKLKELVEFGMDIGHHTYGHIYLDQHGPEEIQRQMAKLQELVNDVLPDYPLDTFALPFGIWPQDEYRQYAIAGEYDGINYENIGVLEVGSYPAVSPFNKSFDPMSIPRVRASYEEGYGHFKFFFDVFEDNPSRRYVSDGDPNYVTVPEELKDKINLDDFPYKELRTYTIDE